MDKKKLMTIAMTLAIVVGVIITVICLCSKSKEGFGVTLDVSLDKLKSDVKKDLDKIGLKIKK